jgi:hypothetical protein
MSDCPNLKWRELKGVRKVDDGWKSNSWLRLSFTECDGDCRSCGPDAPWVRGCIVDLIESISGQSIVNVKVVVVMSRPISANDMSAHCCGHLCYISG